MAAVGMNAAQLQQLYQQAQSFVDNPPADAQALTALSLQLQIAAWENPDQLGVIGGAIENINEAFARIGGAEAEGQHAAPPAGDNEPLQQIVPDVLLPPDPEQVYLQFMEIASQHYAEQEAQPAQNAPRQVIQSAQNAPRPAIQPAQRTPRPNRTAAQALPRTPVAPITNVSATPSQQPVALEPSILDKILQAFQKAIEIFCSWISRLVSYIFGAQNQPSTQIAAQTPQLQTPPQPQILPEQQAQPPATLPQAPLQNQAQPAPAQPAAVQPLANLVPGRFQGIGHIEPDLNRGDQCVKSMTARLWAHLLANHNEDQLSALVSEAVMDQNGNPSILEFDFLRYGVATTQNYQTEIGLANTYAVTARQIQAAKIVKGAEVHLVMIDPRITHQIKFYYFNPHAENAYLQKFDSFEGLVAHLVEAVPVDANTPFALRGLRLNQNLQN